MRRYRGKYNAACYWREKLVGRCTTADSNCFVILMEKCDGDAKRVLREFSYFSIELRTILEKVAAIQEKERRKDTSGRSQNGKGKSTQEGYPVLQQEE